MIIRDATERDHPAIRAIVRHAFDSADEANLVVGLRKDGDALVELVAEEGVGLFGHILYSRLKIERAGETIEAAALAPVSVLPAFQRKGTGLALMRAGEARCRALGLAAIVVLGHPAYYPRTGFSAKAAESLDAPFSGPSFMALELVPGALEAGGKVRYARAFGI
ncbi:MAG: GNAT family N-acetyltransferase [Hyphomonadaceae bacterium]